jgi:Domain of unknown function (DUF4157)
MNAVLHASAPISQNAATQSSQPTQQVAQQVTQDSNLQDARPQMAMQRMQQVLADHSPQSLQLKEHQEKMIASHAAVQMQALVKGVAGGVPVLQKKNETSNNTGMPNQLKAGIESLSGMNMDHVKVHYNSTQPAQLNAHAYAQGSEIHVAPGQEQHLPHEAWHVVQQAQGRVRPTMQMKTGVPVNDDVGLETEADVMGARALAAGSANSVQRFGKEAARTNLGYMRSMSQVIQQRTAVNYVGHFAARHILIGASDEQTIARAASRSDPALHNHVLTDTAALRDTAFEDQLTLECADEARAANYEFVVATPAKKASKVRNDPHPDGVSSARRHVGNYDLTATVGAVTAVLNAGIEQDADAATIKTVKD